MRICLISLFFCLPVYAQDDPDCGELRARNEAGDLVQLALESIEVQVRIEGSMAEVELEQTFVNPLPTPVEAVYVFPMSVDAAVNAYQIGLGERVITGVIRERAEAQRIYEAARDAGQTAGLLEQSRPNVFLQSIANLPPGETVVVRIRYVERLRYDRETGFGFALPLTLTERYATPGADPAVPPGYSLDGSRGARLGIHIEVDAGLPIQHIDSPSHRIDTALEETTARVELAAGQEIPNQDFRLHLRTAAEDLQVTVLAHRDDDLGGYYTLLVMPPFDAEPQVTPRELALVLDISGSMAGEPLDQTKAVATALLRTLTPQDTFNVYTFAGFTALWAPEPRPGTPENIQAAVRWLGSLDAHGGTEIGDAVHRALDVPPSHGGVRLVYLFTDGAVDGDDASAMVQDADEGNRLFSVGMGPAPNRWLIDRLAEEGRGFSSYINSIDEAEEVADRLVRQTTSPVLTDVRIEWEGLQVAGQTPLRIADVFAGRPLEVAGIYAQGGEGAVRVHGRRAGQEVTLRIPVMLPDDADRRPVAYTWARRRIHELMSHPDAYLDPDIIAEITKLGLAFSLVTPYTAFVAVDTQEGEQNQGDEAPEPSDEYLQPSRDAFEGHFSDEGGEGCRSQPGGRGAGLLCVLVALAWRRRAGRR